MTTSSFPPGDAAVVLLNAKHGRIVADEASRCARFVRTSAPFESPEECDAAWAEVVRVLDRLPRGAWRILVDLRDGPLRSDPTFEQIGQRYRRALTDGFARAALLVRTTAGRIQLQRHQREQQFAVPIFDDESQAVAHLLQED